MWKRSPTESANESDTEFAIDDHFELRADRQSLCQIICGDARPGDSDYAVRVTGRLLQYATQRPISDLHLDVQEDRYDLRVRMDGQLRAIGWLPRSDKVSLASRIKSLAGLLTYRTDIPQEGRLLFGKPPREARVTTFPTIHGERIVLRFMNAVQKQWQLADLGFETSLRNVLEQALAAPSGVILITGPAGAGKTTTAYACLRTLAVKRCVVTLEDPVECILPGVAQSQIDPHAGFDWSIGLKSLLRQDPEVLFIGEIRDAATAQTAYRASLTGQLVISTMHARTPAESLMRLLDMQVPSQHLLASTRLLINQQLEPVACECVARQKGGCERCLYSGIAGRAARATYLNEIDNQLARQITSGEIPSNI